MAIPELQLAINNLCETYKTDKNPLHLWTVYRLCRTHKIEIPEDVLEYFDSVSNNFHYLMSRDEIVNWQDVGEAMQLTTGNGRGNKFSLLDTKSKRFWIAFEYYIFKNDGMKGTAIIRMLRDNFDVSESTIKNAWSEYKGIFEGK